MKSLAIEREFGSGGREIGRKVAKEAGIPYYDNALLHKVAMEQGISEDTLKEYDEKMTGSILYDIAALADVTRSYKGRSVYELFYSVQKTIEQLRLQGPAVFMGRCSTEILRDAPRVLRVFVYASDPADRIQRTVQVEGVSESEAARMIEKKDRQRKNYFKFWTQKEWKDWNNYDLELNTSALSPDECAEILLHAIR